MTKEKLALVNHAMNRNAQIYPDEGADHVDPEGVTPYTYYGGMDKMYTEEYGDYCMVTWMGTHRADGDLGQSMNIDPKDIGDECVVSEGLWQSYSGSGNTTNEDFVSVLEGFIALCSANGTQLVFTGHSQGAGAVGVASKIWSEHNPITIMFANAPWIKGNIEDCVPRPNEIWRFIKSENDGGRIVYDPIPNLGLLEPDWMQLGIAPKNAGGYIVLPPGNGDGIADPPTNAVAYYGPEDPEMNIILDRIDFPDENYQMTSAHQWRFYQIKVNSLFAGLADGWVLDTNGFIDGSTCHENVECHSGACEMERFLNPLAMKCYAKLEPGEGCNEDSDCLSESCSWRWNGRRCD
jgi:hypothetical protein